MLNTSRKEKKKSYILVDVSNEYKLMSGDIKLTILQNQLSCFGCWISTYKYTAVSKSVKSNVKLHSNRMTMLNVQKFPEVAIPWVWLIWRCGAYLICTFWLIIKFINYILFLVFSLIFLKSLILALFLTEKLYEFLFTFPVFYYLEILFICSSFSDKVLLNIPNWPYYVD